MRLRSIKEANLNISLKKIRCYNFFQKWVILTQNSSNRPFAFNSYVCPHPSSLRVQLALNQNPSAPLFQFLSSEAYAIFSISKTLTHSFDPTQWPGDQATIPPWSSPTPQLEISSTRISPTAPPPISASSPFMDPISLSHRLGIHTFFLFHIHFYI